MGIAPRPIDSEIMTEAGDEVKRRFGGISHDRNSKDDKNDVGDESTITTSTARMNITVAGQVANTHQYRASWSFSSS
jgi:hypothetical protein